MAATDPGDPGDITGDHIYTASPPKQRRGKMFSKKPAPATSTPAVSIDTSKRLSPKTEARDTDREKEREKEREREQRPDNYMVGKWIEVKGKGG